ncbi:MAG: hypothetical protein KC609_08540 [Myxococcales bacterium]|nr:hypothetical protein [Myxococcales bacterium]
MALGFVGWIGWSIVGAFTYSGPYRWAAECQLWLFGKYGVISSAVLAILPGMVLIGGLDWALRRLGLVPARQPIAAEVPTLPVASPIPVTEPAASARPTMLPPWLIIGLMLCGALLIASAWFAWRATTGGRLRSYSVPTEGRPMRPPSHYLELSGTLLTDRAITYKTGQDTRTLVPLVASDWRSGQPISVYAESPSTRRRWGMRYPATLRGRLVEDGLPGFIAVRLRGQGVLSARHFVLEVGWRPSRDRKLAWVLFLAGLVFGGILLVGLFWRRLRRRIS